jgi:hypothetical protein
MLKKRFTELALVAAMTMSAGAAQAIELVDNGGFETGDFTGWQEFPGGGTTAITTVNPASGIYAANANCSTTSTTTGCDSLLKSANKGIGTVTPGQAITISFDYRGTAQAGGVIFAELFSELSGGGATGEILSGGPLFPNPDSSVWTTATFNTTLGADVSGGVTLQLKSSCGPTGSCVADIYFDNASMTVAAVPVPAAVWLFGSGLLGLIGVARRKKAA